jgi:hypothetical protein
MTWMKINCAVYVETGKDVEQVGSEFSVGLLPAVEHFPGAMVQKADVENIEVLTDEQAAAADLVEDGEI